MTTKLESEVTRLTVMVVEGREVDVTLRPAHPSSLQPEALVLHQRGLKSEVAIPLPAILKAVGWKVQMQKDARVEYDRRAKDEIASMIDALEIALKPWKEGA